MKHLTEEDLVLRYYGEAPRGAGADEHLESCEACRTNLKAMARVLDAMNGLEAPEPLDGLSVRVWQRIAPELAKSSRRRWTEWLAPGRLAAVAAMAALVIAAFLAGRVSQRQTQTAGLSTLAVYGPKIWSQSSRGRSGASATSRQTSRWRFLLAGFPSTSIMW